MLNLRIGVKIWPRSRRNWKNYAGTGTRKVCIWSVVLAIWSVAASPVTRICGSTSTLCRPCLPLPIPLLSRLGWNTQQGRDFLKRHFDHSGRQSLSDEQMMEFNRQLETLLTTGAGHGSPTP